MDHCGAYGGGLWVALFYRRRDIAGRYMPCSAGFYAGYFSEHLLQD